MSNYIVDKVVCEAFKNVDVENTSSERLLEIFDSSCNKFRGTNASLEFVCEYDNETKNTNDAIGKVFGDGIKWGHDEFWEKAVTPFAKRYDFF
jgi:hypothetical protein